MSIHALALGIEHKPLFRHTLLGVSNVRTTDGMRYLGEPFAIATPIAGLAKGNGRSEG